MLTVEAELCFLVTVFLLSGDSAADVALGEIVFQHLLDFFIEFPVEFKDAFTAILMYR